MSLPLGDPVKFYETDANRRLEDHLRRVIDGEGPMPEALLFKRVARAWGLERTGSRISGRLRGLVPAGIHRTREADVTFYWPTGTDPKTWSLFRVAGEPEESKRHVSDVCSQEIAAIVHHVLESAGSTPRSDLAKAICKVVGMARTPADAEARVSGVILGLLHATVLAESDGYIRHV